MSYQDIDEAIERMEKIVVFCDYVEMEISLDEEKDYSTSLHAKLSSLTEELSEAAEAGPVESSMIEGLLEKYGVDT